MSIPGNDLPSLQNLIKRDPQIYKEDFLQQVDMVEYANQIV